jgi:hypothetical protein
VIHQLKEALILHKTYQRDHVIASKEHNTKRAKSKRFSGASAAGNNFRAGDWARR